MPLNQVQERREPLPQPAPGKRARGERESAEHLAELAEEAITVVRAGRGLGVVLAAEGRFTFEPCVPGKGSVYRTWPISSTPGRRLRTCPRERGHGSPVFRNGYYRTPLPPCGIPGGR
jgi:hypothetical protein